MGGAAKLSKVWRGGCISGIFERVLISNTTYLASQDFKHT